MKSGQIAPFIHPDMLYYSHVNEDNSIERKLLLAGDYSVVVAVAGSGERVLAIMDNKSVKRILAIDVNEEALFLLQLKVALLINLTIEDYLKFIGHENSEIPFRKKCFEEVKSHLTQSCRVYWECKPQGIEQGILYAGHFEIFLERIRPLVISFLGKTFLRVLSEENFRPTPFQQLKWKLLSFFFSKKWIYKLWGNKDTAFIGRGASLERIPAALDFLIKSGQAASSFITHLIFKGHLRDMKESNLPVSLQKQALQKIKERLITAELCIEYHTGDLLEFVKTYKNNAANQTFYSASDILSFENHSYLADLLKNILNTPDNIIVVRSFLRNRLSLPQLKELASTYKMIEEFDQMDSSGMYQVVAIKN